MSVKRDPGCRRTSGAAGFAIEGLALAAAAIVEGCTLREEAVEAMARPIIPSWAYRWIGWLGWRQQARKHGVQRQLYARPYEA